MIPPARWLMSISAWLIQNAIYFSEYFSHANVPRVLFDDFLFVLVVLVVIVVNLSKVFVYAAYFFAGVLVLVLVLVGLTKLAAAVDFFADDEVLFDAEAGAAAFAFGVGFFAERVEAALFDPPFFAFVDDTNNGLINWTSCPAQPKTKAMTTTVAAIPSGLLKSPINVSGFFEIEDALMAIF